MTAGLSDKKILPVPHHSQFDINDGFWMIRGCAIVSLKMVLDYFGADIPDTLSLIKEAERMGGFGPSGWYHDTIVTLALSYGLRARREENMKTEDGIKSIVRAIDDNSPSIVSVPKLLLDKKKFHMLVIIGYERDSTEITGLYYHDPESTQGLSGECQFTGIDTFRENWRRMAIFFGKPGAQ